MSVALNGLVKKYVFALPCFCLKQKKHLDLQ